MKRFLMAVLIPMLVVGCRENDVTKNHIGQHKLNIVGEWLLDTIDDGARIFDRYNFAFHSDGTCDNKNGFYMPIDPGTSDRCGTCSVYMSTKATYQIENDSLRITDQNGNPWLNFKIDKIGPTEMVLIKSSSSERPNLARYHFKSVPPPVGENVPYDAVIVTRGACFGTCPINGTYIDKQGEFYFNGIGYNSQNNFLTSKGNTSTFKAFEKQFNKAEITKLKDDYFYGATCGATNYVTFIKNGKIYKTISDYMSASPALFQQTYEKLSYQYQKLNLDYVYNRKFDHRIVLGAFEGKKERYCMSDSEEFYLRVLLEKSKASNAAFEAKYKLGTFNWEEVTDSVKRIDTDGRYFRIVMYDGESQQYDIGFNFIERNKSQLKPLQ